MFGKTLIIAAVFAAVATAADCPGDEINKFIPIASNPVLGLCATESGFSLVPPSGLPNDAQLKKMCVSDNCKKVIEVVKGQNPSNCDLNVGIKINVGKLVADFPSDCARVLATTAPAPGPAPTTTAPGPVTPGTTPSVTQNNGQTGQTTAPTTAPVDTSC